MKYLSTAFISDPFRYGNQKFSSRCVSAWFASGVVCWDPSKRQKKWRNLPLDEQLWSKMPKMHLGAPEDVQGLSYEATVGN